MKDFLYVYDFQMMLAVIFRLVLACVLGAFIGIDRVKKRRPAGIKTHALVCMEAALVMLTDEYIWHMTDTSSSMTRMTAQVISGVGFLGAGTIMVTGRNQIKGLTTAAGLWFSACLGIAVGCGFYVAAITCAVMVIVIVKILARVDLYFQQRSMVMDLYVEYDSSLSTIRLLSLFKLLGCTVIEIERGNGLFLEQNVSFQSMLVSIQIPKKKTHEFIKHEISLIDGIKYLEEV